MSQEAESKYFPKDWALGAIAKALPPSPYELKQQDYPERPFCSIGYWYRLNYYLAIEHSKWPLPFALTAKHEFSYQLLHDWWTAKYQDAAFSLAAIIDLSEIYPDILDAHSNEKCSSDARDLVSSHLRLRSYPSGDILEPLPKETSYSSDQPYHEQLRQLFKCEFGFLSCYIPLAEAERSFSFRDGVRKQAATVAYCQQLAWTLYNRALTDVLGIPPDLKEPHQDSIGTRTRLRNIEIHGPILEPCPWLPKTVDELQNLPLYLWDIQGARTVRVSNLETRPEYIAISHTWGRWSTGKSVKVNGVPWKVPQNTKFKVKQLAKMLHKLPGGLKYVWMDLLCIPQDRSEDGAREIARQAKIFQEARFAIAWLNDVESFEGLRRIIEWQALEMLVISGEQCQHSLASLRKTAWSAIYGKQSGLLLPRNGPLTFEFIQPNPWFTSLWTLQEVCLRPDMWLCAKDWSTLACNGSSPVPISGFVAVLETWRIQDLTRIQVLLEVDPQKQGHIALYELGVWLFTTGLSKLLDLDRAAILTLGDRRHCTERRAEAIMSALGVVNWYNSALSTCKSIDALGDYLEKDLVLGKYPLEFVNQLAKEIPRDFFAAFHRLNIDLEVGESIFSGPKQGTMIPFSRTHAFYPEISFFRQEKASSTTHESLLGWEVEQSGAVRIPTACIITSTTIAKQAMRTNDVLAACIIGPEGSEALSAPLPEHMRVDLDIGPEWVNLHDWIYQHRHDIYAIATGYRYNFNENGDPESKCLQGEGLILECIDGVLVKTFHYLFQDKALRIDITNIQTVNWIVA